MTNHVMLDPETLGTTVDSVVLEVAVAIFNDSFDIVGRYNFHLNVVSQLFEGRTLDYDTLEWWGEQDVFTKARQTSPLRTCLDVTATLQDLQDIIKQSINIHNSKLWANGILFDVGIIDNLCETYGLPKFSDLFFYRNVVDYRTLYGAAKMKDNEKLKSGLDRLERGTAHSAIDGAIYQVKVLQVIYDILGLSNQNV